MISRIVITLLAMAMSACREAGMDNNVPIVTDKKEPLLEAGPNSILLPDKKPSATSIKKKYIDTRLTPEMLKDIRFDIASSGDVLNLSPQPIIMNTPVKSQVMITPKFFMNENDQLKESYLDYLDGAAVQVEVKFN